LGVIKVYLSLEEKKLNATYPHQLSRYLLAYTNIKNTTINKNKGYVMFFTY